MFQYCTDTFEIARPCRTLLSFSLPYSLVLRVRVFFIDYRMLYDGSRSRVIEDGYVVESQ